MNSYRSPQHGFSLLEVLISIVIFSIGLLAVAGLQTVSKQANYESMQRSTASQLAYGLLEDMRTNGDGMQVYLAAVNLGGGTIQAEPVPNCSAAAECNAVQKAAHDLWFWERVIDGDFETNAGTGTGGLVLPSLCITGPALGVAGNYVVTVAWRGTAALTGGVANPCGAASGNYGNNNEFRRILQIPTYIDPNF